MDKEDHQYTVFFFDFQLPDEYEIFWIKKKQQTSNSFSGEKSRGTWKSTQQWGLNLVIVYHIVNSIYLVSISTMECGSAYVLCALCSLCMSLKIFRWKKCIWETTQSVSKYLYTMLQVCAVVQCTVHIERTVAK